MKFSSKIIERSYIMRKIISTRIKIREIKELLNDQKLVSEYEQFRRLLNYKDTNPLHINIQFARGAIERMINDLNHFNKPNIRNKLLDMLFDFLKMREIIMKYSFIYNTENEYEPEMETFVELAEFSKYYDKTKNMNKIFEEYCIFFIQISKFLAIHKFRNKNILNRHHNYMEFECQKSY